MRQRGQGAIGRAADHADQFSVRPAAKIGRVVSPPPGADDGDAQPGFHQATLVAPDLASAYERQPSSRKPRGAGLGWVDEATRAINPPIHVSSTYLRDPDNGYSVRPNLHARHNPAFDQAEALITELEHGQQTMLFASGMAAATAVFQALQPGDHVLAPKVMYWSLRNWLAGFATSWGLDVELIDMTDPAACGRPSGREPRSSSGPRRPRIRSGRSPTSRLPPSSFMRRARSWRSTRPRPRRSSRSRSTSAPTW